MCIVFAHSLQEFSPGPLTLINMMYVRKKTNIHVLTIAWRYIIYITSHVAILNCKLV